MQRKSRRFANRSVWWKAKQQPEMGSPQQYPLWLLSIVDVTCMCVQFLQLELWWVVFVFLPHMNSERYI